MSQQALSLMALSLAAIGLPVTEYRAVDYAGAQATVQGQKVLGVAKRGAAAGDGYDAAVIGTAVIEAGGVFAVGASLIVDAQGRAIASTGDPAEYVFADALQAATGAGDKVEVLLRR